MDTVSIQSLIQLKKRIIVFLHMGICVCLLKVGAFV